MRSRTGLAALAAVIGLLLSGCAVIPQSGAVHQGEAAADDSALEVDILPRDPAKGATQQEILSGFIDAAASPQNGYEIARKFLTSAFDDQWNPDASALVDRGVDREIVATGELSMTLTVLPDAEITAHGQYTEVDSSAPVALPSYEFQKVAGQWRISKAPQGIVIDRPTFDLVFSSYALYFWDPSFTYLVPDVRWFPRRVSTPTKIVRELLAGPSVWLTGAVVSAFPEGSSLTADVVQVVQRDAKVPLNSDALRADPTTLQRMKQQLLESLSTVPTIFSVTISTNQIDQEIPDLPPYEQPRVDNRALVLRDGGFGFLASTGDRIEPLAGLSESIVSLGPSAVTLGTGESAAAVLSAGGVSVVRAGNQPTALDARPGLIAPGLDPFGYVWSVPAGQPGAIQAYAPDGTMVPVSAGWADAGRIVSLRISRDGTRVIALLDTGGRSSFVAAAVIRSDGGRPDAPARLGDPVTLATVDGQAIDATWIDESMVASLTRQADGSTVVITQQIGGPSGTLDGADGAVAMAGGNTERDLRLRIADGTLEQRQGIGWQPRIDGVAVLAAQQGL